MIKKMLGLNLKNFDDWHEIGRYIKKKLRDVWQKYHIKSWDALALRRHFEWATKISKLDHLRWANAISIPAFFLEQDLIPHRKRGRPRMRWHDHLNAFAKYHGFNFWLDFASEKPQEWQSMSSAFIDFVLHYEIMYDFNEQ